MSNIEWFTSMSDMQQLAAYAIFLKEERYEILAELDPLVSDEFRRAVPNMTVMLDHEFCKHYANHE